MTEKCFDIGIIQAFLDGELDFEKSESIAKHVALCDDCAIMLAEAEEESAFAFSVLEQEFNTLVPTKRLWTKINDSIENERKSFWKPIFAFFLQPSTAAFASLVFVFAIVAALLSMKPDASVIDTARVLNSENPKSTAQTVQSGQQSSAVQSPQVDTEETVSKFTALKPGRNDKNEIRAVRISYVREENAGNGNNLRDRFPPRTPEIVTPARSENVAGEESYIKTIATLTESVSSRKDEVLDSSARFAFEKDMAVTDDAIKKMRLEVKQNPQNEAAKQILRASYQNKIDLLNSVAEKNDLMASVR